MRETEVGAAGHKQMIRHHIEDEMLMRYAAGRLGEGWSIGVATHLALCPSCRERLGVFEALGGHFLEEEEAVHSEDLGESWQDLKRRIDAGEVDNIVPLPLKPADDLLPEPLRSYVDRAGGLRWRRLGRGGAAQMILQTDDTNTTVRLLKIPAGQPVPEHTHAGEELTLVLAGSFSDEISTFSRGDVEMADAEVLHTPHAGKTEDCICLAITDAPLRFSSRLLRLIQPLLGI